MTAFIGIFVDRLSSRAQRGIAVRNRRVHRGWLVPGLCMSVVLAACATRGSSGSPRPAAVESIAAKVAELELQRIALHASRSDSSSAQIDSQIRNLQKGLRQDDSVRRVVVARVLSALDARGAIVDTQVARGRLVYTDDYPPIRRAIQERRLIDRRRSELRSGGF